MRRNFLLYTGSIIFCVPLLLVSCKKQVIEDAALQSTILLQSANATACRPALFGVFMEDTHTYPNNDQWMTFAQKWYENGKVKYLKAKSTRFVSTFFDPFLELMFDLDWGEISYQGNQLYLRDVLNNRLLMRVTLDGNGRPAASYYYNQQSGTSTFWTDTTYYYYNNDRLAYMISLFETNGWGSPPIHSWRKYTFSYDSWGNLIKADLPETPGFNIEYDYSKPVQGIILNYQLTSSLSLLQYLELITLPMHHAVVKIGYGGFGYSTEYKDYEIVNGFVKSYVLFERFPIPRGKITFYNGWDCGTGPSMNINKPENVINNLRQFEQVYSK